MLSWLAWGWILPCALGYFFLNWVRRHLKVEDFANKYILITGCDSGFGNLLARHLDLLGFHVFAACLTTAAQSKLRQITSSRLKTFTLDITNQLNICEAEEFVRKNIPEETGLWGLVNNAGVMGDTLGPPEWLTIEDFERVISVNTLGTINMTLTFLPLLKKSKGRIVNMSSVGGRLPSPFTLPYNISKAGIEMFSDGLRLHLAQYDIGVCIIEPGVFQTPAVNKERIIKSVKKGWNESSLHLKDEFGLEYCENLTQFLVDNTVENANPKLKQVVNAYIHSLTARYPRIRYSVGWDAQLFAIPLSYAPTVVLEFVMGKFWTNLVPQAIKK